MRRFWPLGAVAILTAVHVGNASAQTPNVQVRGNAQLQRALNNRATILERANAEARGQSQTRVEINSRNSVEARANAEIRVNGSTRSNGNRGNDRLLPSVGSERLTSRLTGRVPESEVRSDIRGRMQARTEPSRQNEAPAPERRGPEPRCEERPEVLQARAEVLAEARTSPAERLLVKRLAQIDKMRDTALENGNERLLEQADKLEQLARWQFEHRHEARANNPFAEVAAETEQDAELTVHPFRPNRPRVPNVETETNTNVETETTINN